MLNFLVGKKVLKSRLFSRKSLDTPTPGCDKEKRTSFLNPPKTSYKTSSNLYQITHKLKYEYDARSEGGSEKVPKKVAFFLIV